MAEARATRAFRLMTFNGKRHIANKKKPAPHVKVTYRQQWRECNNIL